MTMSKNCVKRVITESENERYKAEIVALSKLLTRGMITFEEFEKAFNQSQETHQKQLKFFDEMLFPSIDKKEQELKED